MTLRHFVEQGTCGSRDERQKFEQMLLVGWADANEHGLKTDPNADVAHELWQMFFEFAQQVRPL